MSNNSIYLYTGNPFVDAGIYAICGWVGKERPDELDKKDLERMINDIVPLYLTSGWSKSQYSIFPNNPITNPSVKDKEEYLRGYLSGLLEEIEPPRKIGTCIACGRRDATTIRTKTEIPMIGSGGLINYFPGGQTGGDYCPACTFAVQFSPLVMYSCIKLLLLHSNSEQVLKYWTRRALQEVREQLMTKNFTGCFNEGYTNPTNALFHIIQDIVLKYEERWLDENPSINLYHFTNYIQGPDLELYTLPTPVFRFLAYMKIHEKYSDWMKVVKRGYYVNWDKVKEEKDYKNKTNKVYLNLLNGISITRYFLDFKNKAVLTDWDLLSYYLMEVRKMDNKRLETLKRIGDEVSNYIKETANIKRLNQLEVAKNYQSFRNILTSSN
jgi:CRISPR-associated protein Cst1